MIIMVLLFNVFCLAPFIVPMIMFALVFVPYICFQLESYHSQQKEFVFSITYRKKSCIFALNDMFDFLIWLRL